MPWTPAIRGHAARKRSFIPTQLLPDLTVWVKGTKGLVTDGAASFAATSSQYLSVAGAGVGLGGATKASFSGWVNLADTSATRTVFAQWAFQTDGCIAFECNGTDVRCFIATTANDGGSGCNAVTTGNQISTGWTHFAAVFDGTQTGDANRLKIYLNGSAKTLSFTGSVPASLLTSAATFDLGRFQGLGRYMNGAIDSFGVHVGRALSQSDVTALYNAGTGLTFADLTAGLKTNLVSWWNLNESTGTRFDSIGSNNLTDNGGVTLAAGIASGAATQDGDPLATWRDQSGNGNHLLQATASKRPTLKLGIQGSKNIVRWDNVDDSLTCTLAAAVPQPFTIFAAAKIGMGGGYLFDDVDGSHRVALTRGIGSVASLDMYAGVILSSGDVYPGAAWKVISLLFNGAHSVMRVNGVTVATGDAGAIALTSIRLGNRFSEGNPVNGDIGEIYAVSGDLTSKFVQNENYLNTEWAVY